MNGNRGAKGSIKDRLISMLYRLRYNKAKESQYTLDEKKKQRKYIEDLKRFKETENLNILENKDKEYLQEIKLFGTFDIKERKVVVREKNPIGSKITEIEVFDDKKKVGLDDLELRKIEMASPYLDTTVNLKQEKSKVKDEEVILKEVTKFVSEAKKEVYEIGKEIEYLKEKSKDDTKDNKEIEERYKKLKEKIDKLKKKFDSIKYKYDLSEFKILESIELASSIDDYRDKAKLQEAEMLINVCKKEIDQISQVEIVYDETKKVGDNIENVNEKQSNIKIRFKKERKKLDYLKGVEEDLHDEIKVQQLLLDEMYYEASRITEEVHRELDFKPFGGVLSSMLRIAGGILTLPLSGLNLFGVSLGTTLINKGLKGLNKSIEADEKITIEYHYEDIKDRLANVKEKTEYISLVLEDSLNEIQRLKSNINMVFSKYKEVIPEYEDTLNKISKLEKRLIRQQLKITDMDKQIEKEDKMNTEKILKVNHMNKR